MQNLFKSKHKKIFKLRNQITGSFRPWFLMHFSYTWGGSQHTPHIESRKQWCHWKRKWLKECILFVCFFPPQTMRTKNIIHKLDVTWTHSESTLAKPNEKTMPKPKTEREKETDGTQKTNKQSEKKNEIEIMRKQALGLPTQSEVENSMKTRKTKKIKKQARQKCGLESTQLCSNFVMHWWS